MNKENKPDLDRKAKLILSDPRFIGTYQDAWAVAYELEFGVTPDSNAMVRKQ